MADIVSSLDVVSSKKIINILKNRGYEAYIVGGAVRDYCMGRTPCDIDLCTNALPEEMLDCFADFKVIPTGLKHGTVTVICYHQHFEITTYRVEKNYFDHRHPVVSFSSSLKDDLSRRDFTINAMAYDDKLIDYFQGLDDLHNKLIQLCEKYSISYIDFYSLKLNKENLFTDGIHLNSLGNEIMSDAFINTINL